MHRDNTRQQLKERGGEDEGVSPDAYDEVESRSRPAPNYSRELLAKALSANGPCAVISLYILR
jgi:hypothetical protein